MNEKTNQIQQEILRIFLYNQKLKYNEIWDKKYVLLQILIII